MVLRNFRMTAGGISLHGGELGNPRIEATSIPMSPAAGSPQTATTHLPREDVKSFVVQPSVPTTVMGSLPLELATTAAPAAATTAFVYDGHFLHNLSAARPGCRGCCNSGAQIVDCLNVEKCAASGPEKGKFALVLSHWGMPSESMLQSIRSMKAAAAAANWADILLVMLQKDADRISPKIQKLLNRWEIKLHVVDWDVPPDSMFYPKHDWCGHQDLIRLHVLALDTYDAVAYYDADCEFQGDITPVLRCAATGKLLTTNGGVGESLNVGFIAVRPDRRLLEAARLFARKNNFSVQHGWGNSGWKPCGGYFVGGECGQGFMYSLFYSGSASARRALEGAGVWENGVFQAAQIDRCIWNYQTSYQCRPDFDCERVRVHHKPTRERGTDRNECEKLRFREKRKEMARRRREERKVQGFSSEGVLLLHSGGFCVRPSDEAFGQGAVLLLRSCALPPAEQNLHMVPVDADDDDEESLGIVQLRIGRHCAYPHGDDMDAEPRLSIAADCSTPHSFLFKRLRAQANGFLLQHTSSRNCIHPFEGQEQPKDGTELLLHSDCSQGRRALTFQEGNAGGLKVRQPQREAPCEYMKSSPQSSRPGKPCIPPAKFWPYRGKTSWRMELGQRILDAVTPVIQEEQCKGFFLYGDVTWCNVAFAKTPPASVGLSYGIEERDIWSELISQKMLPTKLYDCFIPPERSMPMSGKSPNGTRRCQGVEKQPCYATKYESYRICLGAKATVQDGRSFETLHSHLHGMPPLSVHLKIDTEGSEWPVLDALLSSDDIHKLRTLDMEVHFGWTGSFPGQLSAKEQLALQVATMEKLRESFYCTGSTLEVYREGWRPKENCDSGTCNEPPVYLPGGFSMEMFAVSFVNKAMVK
ncbi:unnamed protein product [Symbiodinium microadriaticum]|nr:unnamed protein product [Symbiodinium microadriaticum]CAE7899607.1 unnamed protein product [Symbiodinium sp. KB8]